MIIINKKCSANLWSEFIISIFELDFTVLEFKTRTATGMTLLFSGSKINELSLILMMQHRKYDGGIFLASYLKDDRC